MSLPKKDKKEDQETKKRVEFFAKMDAEERERGDIAADDIVKFGNDVLVIMKAIKLHAGASGFEKRSAGKSADEAVASEITKLKEAINIFDICFDNYQITKMEMDEKKQTSAIEKINEMSEEFSQACTAVTDSTYLKKKTEFVSELEKFSNLFDYWQISSPPYQPPKIK